MYGSRGARASRRSSIGAPPRTPECEWIMLPFPQQVLASCKTGSRRAPAEPISVQGKLGFEGVRMKKTLRKIVAIGLVGAVIGGGASVFMAAPASALMYARCDQQLDALEAQAAAQYKKGKLSNAQYQAILADIAAHRVAWGC